MKSQHNFLYKKNKIKKIISQNVFGRNVLQNTYILLLNLMLVVLSGCVLQTNRLTDGLNEC